VNPATTAALAAAASAAACMRGGDDRTLRRARPAGPGWNAAAPAAALVAPPWPGRWNGAAGLLWERSAPARARHGTRALCLVVGVLTAVALRSPLPAVAALGAAPLAERLLRRRAADRAAGERRAGVIELCADVAGELRTGRLPNDVLARAVAESPWLTGPGMRGAAAGLLAAARFGGDVPLALRRAATAPGAEGLAWMAACWQVALDSGTRLAEGLERVADTLRAEERQREELAAQLAGPRSTALLLAVLPLFGVVLGTAMGAAPLHVLLHTPVGLGCLVLGVALESAGLAWTARIVRGAS
jgi:tight adherence protein B